MLSAKNIAKTGLIALFLVTTNVAEAQNSELQVSDQSENPGYYDYEYSAADLPGYIQPVSLEVKDTVFGKSLRRNQEKERWFTPSGWADLG